VLNELNALQGIVTKAEAKFNALVDSANRKSNLAFGQGARNEMEQISNLLQRHAGSQAEREFDVRAGAGDPLYATQIIYI
jgi:hypothetical protein